MLLVGNTNILRLYTKILLHLTDSTYTCYCVAACRITLPVYLLGTEKHYASLYKTNLIGNRRKVEVFVFRVSSGE